MHELKDFFLVCNNIHLIGKYEEFLLLSKSNHGLNILSCEHLPEKKTFNMRWTNTIVTPDLWDLIDEEKKVNEVSYLASWISRVDDNNGPDFAPGNETLSLTLSLRQLNQNEVE